MFEIGNKVRVLGEDVVGTVVGFIKKGRWDYVTIQTGDASGHAVRTDYRPTILRMADDKPLYDHTSKPEDTLVEAEFNEEEYKAEVEPCGQKEYEAAAAKPAKTATVRALKSDDSPEVLLFISLDLDSSYKLCAKSLGLKEEELRARYSKLNLGMQKMNLVNRVRAYHRKAGAK